MWRIRESVRRRLEEVVECYFCGPRGFMEAVNATLAEMGIPADRRRYEVFGPDITLEAPDTVAA